jgi:hypothetical protein
LVRKYRIEECQGIKGKIRHPRFPPWHQLTPTPMRCLGSMLPQQNDRDKQLNDYNELLPSQW